VVRPGLDQPDGAKIADQCHVQLVGLLADIGVKESEQNISNKLARGSFNAVFMVQVLDAIDCRVLRLKEDE
jgi:Domain of unknown function (DUF6471)